MNFQENLELSRKLAFEVMGERYNSARIRYCRNSWEWYCPYCGKWVTGLERVGEHETIQMRCPKCQKLLVFRMIDMSVENGKLESIMHDSQ